jgi:RNA polymerase sigma-70 factor, ECF subfamily
MTFDGFKIDLSSRSEGEMRIPVEPIAGSSEGRVTIEDRIIELFETLRVSIFKYLFSVFGRDQAAEVEGITQDAFLQLHRALQKGNQIDNPRAWLFRVAHNLAINRIKSRRFIAPLDDLEWDEICARLPDPGPGPEQRAQRLEDFALVHEAMKLLSVQERQCLHLRAEGLRYREIGEILNVSDASVGKYLRRAIKKLMLENNDIHTT